jgi:PIN domain nuclease of toxin-antitoxin system
MNVETVEAVLDASAVLAWLNLEIGGSEVGSIIARAAISAVNLSEIVTKLAERGKSSDVIADMIDLLPCALVDFDAAQAAAAGLMSTETRKAGLSLGDRACLALAAAHGLPAWTSDRAWAKVDVGVDVRFIR